MNPRVEVSKGENLQMLELRFDVLALPCTPVTTPPVEVPWVEEIAGVRMERYFHWQRLACRVTMTSHPVLALPGAPGSR